MSQSWNSYVYGIHPKSNPYTNDTEVEMRFPVQAGVAVRGSIKRAILTYCHTRNISVTVEEDKGFLESVYLFTVVTSYRQAQQMITDLKVWYEENFS